MPTPTTTINVRELVALLQSTRCVCGLPKREGDERCDVCEREKR